MSQQHTVRPGDCMASIAAQYGFFPDTLWNHPQNAELKRRRGDPNILQPGDVVAIPDRQRRQQPAATEATHTFRRKGVPNKVRLRFANWRDEPFANTPCRVDLDGRLSEEQTDGDGMLELSIPPRARWARVSFEDGRVYRIALGHLDPVDEISGVQQRLRNLGYDPGSTGGELDDRTRTALENFQAAQQLPTTGEPDAATRERLASLNGS